MEEPGYEQQGIQVVENRIVAVLDIPDMEEWLWRTKGHTVEVDGKPLPWLWKVVAIHTEHLPAIYGHHHSKLIVTYEHMALKESLDGVRDGRETSQDPGTFSEPSGDNKLSSSS